MTMQRDPRATSLICAQGGRERPLKGGRERPERNGIGGPRVSRRGAENVPLRSMRSTKITRTNCEDPAWESAPRTDARTRATTGGAR